MYETALSILKKISSYGYDAYIVGGYPRNQYMGMDSLDIDLITNMPVSELEEIFELKETHFASSIIVVEGIEYEITAFRKDFEYKNHRFPKKIELVHNLKTDLLRRDFIMNTLCIDQNGSYVDLLGAREDIKNKIIKVVGDTEEKLCEDVLRMLRAIRFATVLDFNLDKEIKCIILKYGYLLEHLSKSRIKKEVDLIMASPNREKGMFLLKELKVEQFIILDNK